MLAASFSGLGLLVNVAKHAHTNDVIVRLSRENGDVTVQVEDHGCGFESRDAVLRRASGVSGMKERVELLSGTFSLETATGKGTRVLVKLPCSATPVTLHPA